MTGSGLRGPDDPADDYFCRLKGGFPCVTPPCRDNLLSYCAPNTPEATERFAAFKRRLNAAAAMVGLLNYVDLGDPNLDERVLALLVRIALAIVPHPAAPPILVALAENPHFAVITQRLPDLEDEIKAIANGKYGTIRREPPPPVRPSGLPWVIGGGVLFLLASTLLIVR